MDNLNILDSNNYKIHRSTSDKTLKNFNKRSLIIDTLKKSSNPSFFNKLNINRRESMMDNVPRYMNLVKKAETSPSANPDDDITATDKNDSTVTTANDQVPPGT